MKDVRGAHNFKRTDFPSDQSLINQGDNYAIKPISFFQWRLRGSIKFYEQCLGGRIEAMRTHASTPAEDQVPAEWRDKILHERLVVGDKVLLASDAPPGRYEKPKGFFVHLQMKDPAEAERIFHALAENGAVQMPFQQTFWAPASACASIDSLYPGWFNVSELRNVV